jgi:CubicO group peptidase (beta-lactamase class C family)
MKCISKAPTTILACVLFCWAIPSFSLQAEPPQNLLSQIQSAMESEVAAHHAAGVVTLVVKDGKIVHHSASGFADRDQKIPMTTDAVFWIASMTKSVSATTIMTLVDEGKLSLDEPALKWLPELGKVKLANGQPPSRPITLRDLMSHTSGLAFPPRKATDGAHSLKSYTLELVKAPLAFEPGSAYEYGFGITVAGRIAEIVSGKAFDSLVNERIIAPLSMKDTSFHPDDQLRPRIAKTYKTDDSGQGLVRANNPFVTSDAEDRRMTEPSGGLFSTARDMAKFYQMILDGGVFEGKRIVLETSIAEMTRPHLASGKVAYGLGWQCSPPEKPSIAGFSTKAFGHGGAFATHGWIDPEQKTVAVLMVQNVMVKGSAELRNAFHAKITGVSHESTKSK